MIQMGTGQNHWPEDISNDDMRDAMQSVDWATKPFPTNKDLGVGVKMACPCGCHSVGVYKLVERYALKFPPLKVGDAISLDPTPAISAQHVRVRVWVLESVQSSYGPKGVRDSHRQRANKMAAMIPGIGDFVASPCDCKPFKRAIWGMIQHLNDAHHPAQADGEDDDAWSRERIADWLETLDADLVLDPDYKHPGYLGPTYDEQVKMVEQMSLNLSKSMVSIKSVMDEMIDSIGKLAASISAPEPFLKATDVHSLSAAYAQGGEAEMAKVMDEKGITTMQLEEALTQPSSSEKHDPCTCFVCKIQNKKTNQEES